MGTKAARNRGVETDMIMTVESKERKQRTSDFILIGIDSSTASMSLLNRFTIRPSGVESKNRILVLSIEFRSFLCNSRAALTNINV